MSPALDSGGAGGSRPDWNICGDAPVHVGVDGTEVPTSSVTTWESRDGVADLNRMTQVTAPVRWKGRSVIAQIGQYDMASVSYMDAQTGKRRPVHRGFVRSIGGSTEIGTFKFYISSPSALMTSIPFAGKYDEVAVSTILSDVQAEFRDKTQFTGLEVRTSAPSTEVDPIAIDTLDEATDRPIEYVKQRFANLGKSVQETTIQFRSNKHTLKSVMDRITSLGGGYWYFSFDGSRSILVYDPSGQHKQFDLTKGNRLLSNDALEEIAPINSLELNGATGVSIGGHQLRFLPSKSFPHIEASYPPLVGRTGAQASTKVVDGKSTTLAAGKEEAKKTLKDKIQNNGEGDIKLWGMPALGIFDRITAKPTCAGEVESGVRSLDMEVQSLTHTADSGKYRTRANTAVYVNYGDIQIDKATMQSHTETPN